jgi:demethylmenaquinone methyltransferase/2-methoxy-6-polyprenyl-1,4-benzoquinol methylase
MNSHPKKSPESVVPHPPLERYYGDESGRRRFVGNLFDTNAVHYEWITRVMSLGSGSRYRRDALRRAGIGPGMTVLDVCAGSGQVSRVATGLVGGHGTVVALDASMGMLNEARRYVDIPLVSGLVEDLPFTDDFADAITMGYALRHVADLRETFREFRRVLKPGGTLLMIEFARPRSRAMYLLLRAYLGVVVPAIARIKGRHAARMMRYFWDTIESCVAPETILDTLREIGFDEPKKYGQIDLFAEYTGIKPARAPTS